MSKKKKDTAQEERDFFDELEEEEANKDNLDNEDDDDSLDDDDDDSLDDDDEDINSDLSSDDDIPDNPMGLAHQISKESETIKNFKELPREVKYSFYDAQEKADIKHYARTYRNWKYIEKIIDLRSKEDYNKANYRNDLIKAKNKDDLIEYLKNTNKDYLINDIDDLTDEELEKLITKLGVMKANYFMDSVEARKDAIDGLYEEYLNEHDMPSYIDDMGNLGKIMDTSLASMGFKGNAAQHSVMTINAVKNEDIQKAAEEKTKFSILDTIRRKLG